MIEKKIDCVSDIYFGNYVDFTPIPPKVVREDIPIFWNVHNIIKQNFHHYNYLQVKIFYRFFNYVLTEGHFESTPLIIYKA